MSQIAVVLGCELVFTLLLLCCTIFYFRAPSLCAQLQKIVRKAHFVFSAPGQREPVTPLRKTAPHCHGYGVITTN